MRPLKIASIQVSLREGDPEGNTKRARALLEEAGRAGAGLAVLPEMWWTGFSYRRLSSFADETPASLAEVGEICRRRSMTVVALTVSTSRK